MTVALATSITVVLLAISSGMAATATPAASADELAHKIINNECKAEAADQSHWMFRLETTKSGKSEVKEVVETKAADLERVVLVNGKSVAPREAQRQEHALEEEIHNPSDLRELQKSKLEDIQRTQRMLNMLPDAFNFTYAEVRGDLTKLNFTPNPNFRPPSREARVFHAMEGEILLNTKQERLVEISGHLIREVKFGGGLLGHLAQGGEFHVKQTEVEPGFWELTLLHVNMRGKALFFKSISVQQDEIRSEYRRVSDDRRLRKRSRCLINMLHRYSQVKKSRGRTTSNPISPRIRELLDPPSLLTRPRESVAVLSFAFVPDL